MTTLRGMFPFTCTLTLAHLSLQISWIICLQITIRLWINDHNSTHSHAMLWCGQLAVYPEKEMLMFRALNKECVSELR